MDVILLERIERLGNLGQVVKVKDGFARNFLLPQGKALRATKDNLAVYEQQKAALEAANAKRRDAAQVDAKKVDGLHVIIVRQAAESGHLFGSVSARDIADAIAAASNAAVTRANVILNHPIKSVGVTQIPVALHPEVKVMVTVNVARSNEEAEQQKKTGKAVAKETGKAEDMATEAEAA